MKTGILDLKQPCRLSCLPEERFAEQMETVVEPFLKSIRRPYFLKLKAPQAGLIESETGFSARESARSLYCELYPNPDAKATIAISYGFCESSLKYHEHF